MIDPTQEQVSVEKVVPPWGEVEISPDGKYTLFI